MPPRLLALSDLHVAFPENRKIVDGLRPEDDDDWLLLAGDTGELSPDIEWALRTLSERFAAAVWTPGNHDLWTHREDPVQLRGEKRYLFLVDLCRSLGIVTPEDPYRVWRGPGGPVTIVPLFLLYDYTFRPEGALTKEQGLALAYETGVFPRRLSPASFAGVFRSGRHAEGVLRGIESCRPDTSWHAPRRISIERCITLG